MPPPGGETPVIGWQEAVLNRNGICDSCNAILTTGQRAGVGVPMQTRPVLLCMDCLTALGTDGGDNSKEASA